MCSRGSFRKLHMPDACPQRQFEKARDDNSSWAWHFDQESLVSRCSVGSIPTAPVSTEFSFDSEIVSSRVYRKALRSNMVFAMGIDGDGGRQDLSPAPPSWLGVSIAVSSQSERFVGNDAVSGKPSSRVPDSMSTAAKRFREAHGSVEDSQSRRYGARLPPERDGSLQRLLDRRPLSTTNTPAYRAAPRAEPDNRKISSLIRVSRAGKLVRPHIPLTAIMSGIAGRASEKSAAMILRPILYSISLSKLVRYHLR